MCEYDTLESDVYDGIEFWTVRSYYFWILPLMSLTGVLMTSLILTNRCRDDLDSISIEDVTLFSYDLDLYWISLILRTFYSSFVISVSVDLVDLEDIQYLMIDSLLLLLFSYIDRIIVIVISLISVIIYIQSLIAIIV